MCFINLSDENKMNLFVDVVFCFVLLFFRFRILLMEKLVIGCEDIGGLVKGFCDFFECVGFLREIVEVKIWFFIKVELIVMLDML